MPDPRFTTYRTDGWPLCPQCDEDELYSHVCLRWDGVSPRPTLDESLAGDFTCYVCGWSSGPPVTLAEVAPARLAASGGRWQQISKRWKQAITARRRWSGSGAVPLVGPLRAACRPG